MYTSQNIRNVAVLGHLGSGKTTLVEACYALTNGIAVKAKGSVEKKNTVSDFMIEEQQRLSSISNSIVPIFTNDFKFNLIDAPGNDDFIGEVVAATNIVKGAILVVDAESGVEVGTVKHWNMLRKRNIPTFIFVNKMDKENVDLPKTIEGIRKAFGKTVVPFEYPLGVANKFEGYVDIVDMIGRRFNGDEVVDFALPEKIDDEILVLRNNIMEAVAETSEDLMEKFFAGEEISPEEIKKALRTSVLVGEIAPILVGCSTKSIGIKSLLAMLGSFLPSPCDLAPMIATDENGNKVTLKTTNDEPFSALVFKTTADQYAGVSNIFKIYSGTIKVGDDIYCSQTGKIEKVQNLSIQCGKKQIDVLELGAGDIGCINKLSDVRTSMTLCNPKNILTFEPIPFPTAVLFKAIKPKNKADEDKIGQALTKIKIEDPTIETTRNAETKQLLLGGQGTGHITYIIERLKNTFKVDVDVEAPKIVYRETIKGKSSAIGSYKKQSGGSGHYGVVDMRWEPAEENEFAEEVFGGSVPRNFFPAVEKGFYEAIEAGLLAGFPVIGIKAILTDGKYHPVDSDELSFKNAAILSYKEAYMNCKPTILEPIMKVSITVLSEYTGDLLSDINTRRAKILSMEEQDGQQTLIALVPEAELVEYANVLKSITKSSGMFSREFCDYEEVPAFLIDKVIKENKLSKD